VTATRIGLAERSAAWLVERLPEATLAGHRLDATVVGAFRRELAQMHPLGVEIQARLAEAGYVIVELPAVAMGDLRVATAVGCLAGWPLRVVGRWPLWIELGVDLDAEPHRFGGVGHNPLHIDLVNASAAPRYVCLLGLRCDPLGGGWSIVSDLRAAAARLSHEHRAVLMRPEFREGRFYDLHGVGRGLDAFAVLGSDDAPIRFTAKMLLDMPQGPQTDALAALERELVANQHRFLLERGHLLIVDNHRMAHGREPLGRGQPNVPSSDRRLLRQTYLGAVPA
jgi:hypothetical protein